MTIKDWLRKAERQLTDAGIGTARLDALIMLEKATGHDRGWLLAHDDAILKNETKSEQSGELAFAKFYEWLSRRVKHEPLTYILGEVEFYGRGFYVDERVLVPRPESETMIDLVKHYVPKVFHTSPAPKKHTTPEFDISAITFLDIGTGSGALAITTKLFFPTSVIYANDIDPQCLEVARKNAQLHDVAISFFEADLLSTLPKNHSPALPNNGSDLCFDVVLANLPYVPAAHTINAAAMHEPSIAIFGGEDGLDLYRRLFKQAAQLKVKAPRLIFTESLPFQHASLRGIANQHGYHEIAKDDFIQVFQLTH